MTALIAAHSSRSLARGPTLPRNPAAAPADK
jgi:hypothetical protein